MTSSPPFFMATPTSEGVARYAIAPWALVDDPRLSPSARGLIEDSKNILFVSAATVWEISITRTDSPGKIPISGTEAIQFLQRAGYRFLDISRTLPPGWKPSLATTTIPSTALLWPKP